MPKKYSDEILQKAYDLIVNKKYSANKTSKTLGIDNGTMRMRLKEKYGDIFLKDGKKKINSNYFNEIDSEDKAYWLGFLTADGYVNKNNTIELCLAEIDIDHLYKFKTAINSDHSINKKVVRLNDKEFYSYRISFRDTQISNNLKDFGLNNEKSYNAFIPDNLPDDLMRHYIRGLFDGDGSIYQGSNGLNISFISGSEQMIIDINNVIKKHLNLDMKNRISRNLYETRLFSNEDVSKFLQWLYADSTIYLNRKYNKALAVLEQSCESSKSIRVELSGNVVK